MTKYGVITLLDRLKIFSYIARFPLVITWNLLRAPFTRHLSQKPWRRVIVDTVSRFMTSHASMPQLQFLSPSSIETYKAWVDRESLPVLVDDLKHDGRLLWLGQRTFSQVLLYIHGGCFHMPLSDQAISFCRHVQLDLQARTGSDLGLAILNYSLLPDSTYPIQIEQAISAVRFLVDNGASASNIQLMGDSAGANLILAILSHIEHPIPSIPLLEGPFAGAYLMSPWVSLDQDPGATREEASLGDFMNRHNTVPTGHAYLQGVTDSFLPYANPASVSSSWFAHAKTRVLVTYGQEEFIKEDVELFVQEKLPSAEVVRQENGIHIDPIMDFMAAGRPLSGLTNVIIDWLARGFC